MRSVHLNFSSSKGLQMSKTIQELCDQYKPSRDVFYPIKRYSLATPNKQIIENKFVKCYITSSYVTDMVLSGVCESKVTVTNKGVEKEASIADRVSSMKLISSSQELEAWLSNAN